MAGKTLNIYARGLNQDTTVILMFQPPKSSRLFRDQFPVVWKVINFHARSQGKASIRYNGRFACGYVQIDQENLVDSTAWAEVKSGDISSPSGAEEGDSPLSGSQLLVYKNNTNARANLSIGLIKGNDTTQRYEPTLVWTDVEPGSSISSKFTPTLAAYVIRDYKASQMLRGEVETDAIWECKLNEVDDVTGWDLLEDEESGEFSIEAAKIV